MTPLKSYVYDQLGNMPKGNLYYLKYYADKAINELRSENEILHKQSLHKDGIIASLEARLESCEARVGANARYEIAELRKENKALKEALERQQNAYLTLDEAYQRDTGIVCKAVNPGVPCAEMKKVMEENESLKDELLDAKRDACRFEKAMYRATFNWAHARSFIYMKEHYVSISSEIPRQWRRALDLCKLGYNFAEIAQDKLPKKPKPEQETTEV